MTPAERQEHLATLENLFGVVQEIRERDDGFAFRLANDETVLTQLAAFVAKERLCCPFFGFEISVESDSGPVWLSVTGPEGVKPFIKAEFGGVLDEAMAREAAFV